MLILQITDTHIKLPGKLAYRRVDTAAMLRDCVAQVQHLDPKPDVIALTGDLVDLGRPEEYAHLKEILAPLRAPIYAIPGNHDDRNAMRDAFRADGYLPAQGYLNYAVDTWPLRLIGLDTVVPQEGGGELCADRLAWLDGTLAQKPAAPTVVMMHHPPFPTAIAHMDRIGLKGREGFAAVMARHPQVQAILCGHLHRTIQAVVGGRRATTCPSPAHQVALDLRAEGPSAFCMEPPGYMLHLWRDGMLVSHTAVLGEHAGPFPFFEPTGQLID
jgi:3',5'-cyclic-AMP phosphodiesterase